MPKLLVTSKAIRGPQHTVRCPQCGEDVETQGLPTAPGGVRYRRHNNPVTQVECPMGEKPVEKPP